MTRTRTDQVVATLESDWNVTHEGVIADLLEQYDLAEEARKLTEYGSWYRVVRRIIGDLSEFTGHDVRAVTLAFAELSPRCPIEENMAGIFGMATGTMDAGSWPGLGETWERAALGLALDVKFLARRDKKDGAMKVKAFFRGLMGDTSAVTIDALMMAVIGFEGTLTDARYRVFAEWITEAAEMRGVNPRDFQAIVWCQWKYGKRRTG